MLTLARLEAFYGKSQVLRGVDLEVRPGCIVGLLGRNGAGRSTLLKAVMGEVYARGSIKLDGVELLGLDSHRIARAGIGYVPENRDVFPDLTVRQNLILGVKAGPGKEFHWSMDTMLGQFPRLAERHDVMAGSLSGGEQQMLTMARSLLGNPRVLLVDEPTEGLAPKIVQQIARLLEEVAASGVGVLLVEQKLSIALSICSVVHVLGHGRIVYSGSPEALRAAPEIARQWLAV